jgi:hypothetical protein
MNNRKDICTPRKKKDGGTYWVKIGTAWEGEKGTQLVFDALPIPDSEGRVVANLFEPRESNTRGTRTAAGIAAAYVDDGADAPF